MVSHVKSKRVSEKKTRLMREKEIDKARERKRELGDVKSVVEYKARTEPEKRQRQ